MVPNSPPISRIIVAVTGCSGLRAVAGPRGGCALGDPFPERLLLGCGHGGVQIEGAWNEDGKGESIWDRFGHTPGKIKDGSNGDVTCDHYHRYREDVALMRALNLNSYRFSVAWTRIQPEGVGKPNPKAWIFTAGWWMNCSPLVFARW